MKLYKKDGIIVERPKSLIIDGKTYVPPTDKQLIEAGYVIEDYVEPVLTNEDIKLKRQLAYEHRADKYLTAYQAYKELGETDKALEMKELWLKEREAIDKEIPYITE